MNILAIDQGTTGTTTVLYDRQGQMVDKSYRELPQIYPKPGWVEHDPERIWQTVVESIRDLLSRNTLDITAIGITNQRETSILWNKYNGKPVYNAIVWQCRRTAEICEQLSRHKETFYTKTGLPIDPYFSGTKIKWLLDRTTEDSKNLLFGTVDSWLIWKLTGGKNHLSDYSNASRTLLFNILEKKWDGELLQILGIPKHILPDVQNSVGDFGTVTSIPELEGIPICGVAGDQQAALFGQTCFDKNQIKNTYGTGCFVVMNIGEEPLFSKRGLITTLATNSEGNPCYALEGSVFIAGAAIQWLRDELTVLQSASDSERTALMVKDNGGVYMVPAFVGLGAPHWNMRARGIITGITRGTHKNHIIRAALESMAFQTYDVLVAMEEESGEKGEELMVDGGAANNTFLMQFQADLLNKRVNRPKIIESTSLGAAYMAGLHTGVWKSEDLKHLKAFDNTFYPKMTKERRARMLEGWRHAVRQCVTP